MAKPNLENPLYKLPNKPTNLGGVMWIAVAVGLGLLLIVGVIATQYLAAAFGYQDALGTPLFTLGSVRVYHPFGWISWIWKWRELENPVVRHHFTVVYMIVIIGSGLSVLTAAYITYRRTRNLESGAEHLHGSAHWATEEEIKATTLLPMKGQGKGVYVGAWKHPKTETIHYLRHDGPEHIIAFAPTRSGKGVGLVLPTLLSWPNSVLVYDIKGENWALTAGWRKQEAGNYTLKFEPTATDGSSVCFNPLEEIRLGTDKEVSDVQNIVTMIVDPDGKGLNDHWAKTGHALLVGTMLHVLYSENDRTLAGLANFLSEPTRTLEETLHYMLGTEHDPDRKRGWTDSEGKPTGTHPVVAASARDMLNKSENEMSGVLSTAMSFLTLYRDPVVAKNTRYSQFKVSDLMNADKPMSLYLVVPPSDKDRLKPLIRLVINQVVRSLTEKMEFKDGRSVAGYRHRLLLLIDEFPSLGKLDIFEESLAFIAGYGMKAYLIVQDISQLWAAYGKDESIFSNCHVRIAYAPNKIETAKLLSDMTGTTTIVKTQNSYSGDRLTPMLSNVSTSQNEVSRPLLTPDEVMRLPAAKKDAQGNILEAGDMLIFVAGHAPVYGKQILYFTDPTFSTRAKVATPAASDRLYDAPIATMPPIAAKPADAEQAAIAAASAASHLAANPEAAGAIKAAAAAAPAAAPAAEAVAPTDVVLDATLNTATEAPVGALIDDLIEEAPENVGTPIEHYIEHDGGDHHDDMPPIEALAQGPINVEPTPGPAAPAAGGVDDLLMAALAVSAKADESDYSMFDDILAGAPASSTAKASIKSKASAKPQEVEPGMDGLDDLLAEIRNDPMSR